MKSELRASTSQLRVLDRWGAAFFLFALAVYAVTRFTEIEAFPIYFFPDEAMHSVQFRALVANHWRAVERPYELLPAYFMNGGMFNLSLSVYVQGIATWIGGRSVETVRTTFALVSLTQAVALALLLRNIFRISQWWSVVAFLTVLPCWFLHSRTGFETVLMVSCFSWFLFFYALYRESDRRWVFAAVGCGAATFYAYSPGQGIMFVTGLLLVISDGRFHWRNRRVVIPAAVLAVVLFVPYLRFRWLHPAMMREHLQILDSYWIRAIPLTEKVSIFLGKYFAGLSPRLWFEVGADDAIRHVVPGYAHLPLALLPLAAIGLVVCFARIKSAAHRLILVAIVAAPFSSALVAPMVTRLLALIVPFALCCALGFEWLLAGLSQASWRKGLQFLSLSALTMAGVGLMRVALVAGPIQVSNYGLYGAQWGAQNVFRDRFPHYVQSNPEANFVISSLAFNSPEVFPEFFGWMDRRRLTFASLDDICAGSVLPEVKDIVMLKAEEFDSLASRPAVLGYTVTDKITRPDGRAGFYLGHLRLRPDFMEHARESSRGLVRPEWDRLLLAGFPASVIASGSVRGRPGGPFMDERTEIVSRPGEAINMEVRFGAPVRLGGVKIESEINPRLALSVWGTLNGQVVVTKIGKEGSGSLITELGDAPLDSLRIELSGRANLVGRLRRVEFYEVGAAERSSLTN